MSGKLLQVQSVYHTLKPVSQMLTVPRGLPLAIIQVILFPGGHCIAVATVTIVLHTFRIRLQGWSRQALTMVYFQATEL